jgi:uncharacterized protein YbjQ (UPF0145 family)
VRGGLLSVEETAALSTVGFEPVCEVLGAVSQAVNFSTATWQGQQGAKYWSYRAELYRGVVCVPPSDAALKAGYRTAAARLSTEARAAGADGVVGLRIERTVVHVDESRQRWDFLAIGTAVRSRGRTHLAEPFTTDLSAGQTATALRTGWMPVSYLVAAARSIRVVDAFSRQQRRRRADNGEVAAYTKLVTACRARARKDFGQAATAVSAAAAVQSGQTLTLETDSADVAIAEVTITGTALTRLGARATTHPRPLTVIPLWAGAR